MMKINSVEQLKECAIGGKDFVILLNFGAKSSKNIAYDKKSKRFDLYHEIDGSIESLTEAKLMVSNVGLAIQKGALFLE